LLSEAYEENSLSTAYVFEWHKTFTEVRENGPVTMKTDKNVGKVRNLMRTDRRLGIRMTAEGLNMDKQTARKILTTNLNMKECMPKWSQRVRQFLATKQIPTLGHPPCLPDVAPCDFLLFPKLKSWLKGTYFSSNASIIKRRVCRSTFTK
jgi:hypothetical protein